MAMFSWSGIYISPEDVCAIYTNKDTKNALPYYMKVLLRNGREYQMNYSTESARDTDAQRLANCVNRLQPEPVTYSDVDALLKRTRDAIRRDMKAILRKGDTDGE